MMRESETLGSGEAGGLTGNTFFPIPAHHPIRGNLFTWPITLFRVSGIEISALACGTRRNSRIGNYAPLFGDLQEMVRRLWCVLLEDKQRDRRIASTVSGIVPFSGAK